MSFRALLVVVLLGACAGPDDPIDVRLLAPDAAIDAPLPDACVETPSDGCCALLPDTSAVIACSIEGQPPEACGVIACRRADCSTLKLNYCVPPADAGPDARSGE